MRSIALVGLFFIALGTGCASTRTKRTTYVAQAPSRVVRSSYTYDTTYSSYARRAPTPVVRSSRAAPVYGTSWGRRPASRYAVPPPPPPPSLYHRARAPVRAVAYSRPARSTSVRPAVTPTRRAASRARGIRHGRSCTSFVGGFAGVLPASSCRT